MIKERKLIKLVGKILKSSEGLMLELAQNHCQITELWRSVKDRIETEEVTQAECEQMAALWAEQHRIAQIINNAGLTAHAHMVTVSPSNISEGQKCYPGGEC